MKKNRKRGLAPGTAGFSKLYSGKEPRWGQNEGPRRGILKRRGGERNARPKQFYNTGRRCDIAPSCFLLSGKGPKLSLSLSPLSHFLFPLPSILSPLHPVSLSPTRLHNFEHDLHEHYLFLPVLRTHSHIHTSISLSFLPLFLTTPFSSVVFLPLSSPLFP